jgi:AraC-like DNA-binding protein
LEAVADYYATPLNESHSSDEIAIRKGALGWRRGRTLRGGEGGGLTRASGPTCLAAHSKKSSSSSNQFDGGIRYPGHSGVLRQVRQTWPLRLTAHDCRDEFTNPRRDRAAGRAAPLFVATRRAARPSPALKASDMAIPIDTSDDRLLKMMAAHCEAVLKDRGTRRARLLRTVERRIVDLLPKGAARATVIATELGFSQRTLTRQLAALRTSFNEVLDEIRKRLALKYVHETDLRLAQVAFLLGYANPPAFTLAFRRWTGRAPSELRRFSDPGCKQ